MKKPKEIKLQQLEKIKSLIPDISKNYKVIEYPKFIKIINHNNVALDYYPMGEKLRNCTSFKWYEMSIEDFIKKTIY